MFISKRNAMRKHTGLLTPKAMENIETAKMEALSKCKCYGQDDKYEVDHYSKTFVVDLTRRTCGCNMWDITCVPCCHAICCIMKRRLNVVQFVDRYYHKETYLRAYSQSINPMPGHDQWERTSYPQPLSPKFVIQPGRPKKSRKKEQGEGKKRRFRLGGNHCCNCGQEGHYKNNCKNPPKQPEVRPASNNKGGRPRKNNNVKFDTRKRKYTKKVRTETPLGEEHAHDLFGPEETINQTQESVLTSRTGTLVGSQGESSTAIAPQRKKARHVYPLSQPGSSMITTRAQLQLAISVGKKKISSSKHKSKK